MAQHTHADIIIQSCVCVHILMECRSFKERSTVSCYRPVDSIPHKQDEYTSAAVGVCLVTLIAGEIRPMAFSAA